MSATPLTNAFHDSLNVGAGSHAGDLIKAMKFARKLEETAARKHALLIDVRTALITAGWNDDEILRRLRAEISETS
jgi:hypothetical protein